MHLAENEEHYPSSDRFRAWFEGMSNVTIHVYPGTRRAFFNDGVRTHYDSAAASLSWDRTTSFLRQHLMQGRARRYRRGYLEHWRGAETFWLAGGLPVEPCALSRPGGGM